MNRRRIFAAVAVALGLLAAVTLLEVFLRLYDPIGFRVRGDEIVLPYHEVIRIENETWPKLDPVIVHSKNSLGFRGPEPPKFFDRALTVVAVGGSTTECFYLADGHDWPAVLAQALAPAFEALWVNNAGLDGHSTFGHRVLVEKHLLELRPKVLLLLIGVNDMGLQGPRPHDQRQRPAGSSEGEGVGAWLARHSALGAFVLNLRRYEQAVKKGLVHPQAFDLRTVPEASQSEAPLSTRLEVDAPNRQGFEQRLKELVALVRGAGVEPVLVTQPALFGAVIDPTTGLNLGNLEYWGWSGADAWTRLETYNDVTRRLGAEAGVPVIDLARELPKDSRYFYDFLHYTNEGSVRAAQILAAELCPWLARRFPAYRSADCPSPAVANFNSRTVPRPERGSSKVAAVR